VRVNQWGRIVAWAEATANVHDRTLHPLIARFEGQTTVLTNGDFHRKVGDLANMKVCERGTWPQRILIETVFSLLTRVCQLKRAYPRAWATFQATSPSPSRCSTCWSGGRDASPTPLASCLWRLPNSGFDH